MIIAATILLAASVTADAAPDYSTPENWLCLPGHEDACAVDLSATIVQADGSTKREDFAAAKDPQFDCFYVYPTVSLDPTPNSDLTPGDEERLVTAVQFARFSSVCRPFAPMYRQVTMAALREMVQSGTSAASGPLAYGDVEAAFDYYLAHYNEGRPFVLIGHSQGTRMLTKLLQDRFDHTELKKQLISALLIGAPINTRAGGDVGGTFETIPVCTSDSQTGCVVAYSSFRSDAPPPENSRYGKPGGPGLEAACTNPAALGGGDTAPLDAYFGTSGAWQSTTPQPAWAEGLEGMETPFVKVPGLLTATCADDEHGRYLSVTVHGDPADPRVDNIPGDIVVNGNRLADWGLHLIDMHLTQGDLIALIQKQAAAWRH